MLKNFDDGSYWMYLSIENVLYIVSSSREISEIPLL